jgi:hypothetical protein
METKKCYKCKLDLPITSFYKNKARPDGYNTGCKECHKKENIEYRHRSDVVYEKEFAAKQSLKQEVFSNYCDGEIKCRRCGFKDIRALTLDHINGDGSAHRRELNIRSGTQFYRWVRDNECPEGLQVLCMNCQWIKRYENFEHNGHKKIQPSNELGWKGNSESGVYDTPSHKGIQP